MIRPLVRSLVIVLVCGAAVLTPAARESTGPGPASWADDLTPITTADWNYDRAAHLIERAGFRATAEEIERLAALTPEHLVGQDVKGGFYGQHPSLTDLDDGTMKMTTDFRRVYATAIKEWLGYDQTQAVLKGTFAPMGVFA